MKKLIPDLDADLVPGVCAAGFTIGESLVDIEAKIGAVERYGPGVPIRDALLRSNGWIAVERRVGFGEEFIFSYRYMNELVSLYFEGRKVLYRVAVGKGYQGSYFGVRPGDSISKLSKLFDVDFNSDEDEFLVVKDNKDVLGVSFVTDYRASLEHAPEQTIQFISIHDWSLR